MSDYLSSNIHDFLQIIQARHILRRVIRSGQAPERWAAAQCLAHAGVCDSYVVGELVQQVFSCENVVKFEQCVSLMAKLSKTTTIVHSMVAEQLNSTSWRHRIVACRVLPRLSGTINKVSYICVGACAGQHWYIFLWNYTFCCSWLTHILISD